MAARSRRTASRAARSWTRRPPHNLFIEVYSFDGAPGPLEIAADGQMLLYNGPDGDTTSLSSLATISYPVSS